MLDSNIVHGPPLMLAEEWENTILDECIIAAAKQRSNDVYLIDASSNENLTVKEFLRRSHSLAAELQRLGCNKDTIVGIISENRLEYPIVILGTVMTGATLTCFNPHYTFAELKSVFKIAKPTIIFCSSENYSKLMKLITPLSKIIIFDSEKMSDVTHRHHLRLSKLIRSSKIYTEVTKRPDDTMLILYSSGTTGLPKGVMLTHKNIVFFLKLSQELMKYEDMRNAAGAGVIGISVAPFFHTMAFNGLLRAFVMDQTLVIMRKFDTKLYLSAIQNYKIKNLSLVPTLLKHLLKDPAVDNYDLSSIESAACGSAPLQHETEKAFTNKFKLKSFRQGYGLTECTFAATFGNIQNTKSGTCGTPLPGTQMKVVETQTGKTLGKYETGEICIKGPHIMKGYYRNRKATVETVDEDGWLHTGDIGYYDEDGDFFIVGRAKELIKYKGFQVAPAELEALLLTHPAIADCGVVGMPDETAGELPRAFVVKHGDAKITENEIIQYIAGKVSPQKRLRGGVEFVQEIPRNATGKILRQKLRERCSVKCKSHL